MPIFFVSAHNDDGTKHRTFGWFPYLVDAMQAVNKDHGGMHECLYSWLCIEKQSAGIHAMGEVVMWYEWKNNQWELSKKIPEWSVGVCNFSHVG